MREPLYNDKRTSALRPFIYLPPKAASTTIAIVPGTCKRSQRSARPIVILKATQWRDVSLADETQVSDAVGWWNELTERGNEGIVVKPFEFVTSRERGLVQPALQVRGAEYLRIVYGPEFSLPRYLSRLRQRGLATKRRLALQEFTLGLEALHRFVERAPLRSVHECVFGVLALESEPVDARL